MLAKILKSLAKATLRKYKPTIVGVTGNVGKTSTKFAIESVVRHAKRVRASAKSFNNEIGFPLAILGNWKETGGIVFWCRVLMSAMTGLAVRKRSYPDVLVLEYGVDRPQDMDKLLRIATPDIAVATAIGDIPVHVEFFAGKSELAREKAKLVRAVPAAGQVVLNADDATVYAFADDTRATVTTYGFGEQADVRITAFEQVLDKRSGGVRMKLEYKGNIVPVRLQDVLGRAQGYAAAAAASVGLIFGMNLVTIAEALNEYRAPAGRLRIIPGVKHTVIIDDTYNASPLATEEALDALAHAKARRKVGVLGDMLEIGKYTLEAHQHIGAIAAKCLDVLVTVGMRGKFMHDTAIDEGMKPERAYHCETVSEAQKLVQELIRAGDVILVKASQAVRLEKVVKEIMAEPELAPKLLVRQDSRWLAKRGSYE